MLYLLNPTLWIGLITLVILEIVLSIDNLIFLSLLISKLPPKKRDTARFIGLGCSLIIRMLLLTTISWITTLNNPIFSNKYFNLSGHDLILLFGGLFLLIKTTIELYEKLKKYSENDQYNKYYSEFWIIVIQITIVDIIFSLDSVITAIGMVNKLFVMIFAVIISTFLMLLASTPLTKFINTYNKIVVLCLSFLLMIGLNLISESFGVYISNIYLYVAIGFALFVEIYNQISINITEHYSVKPIRQRVIENIVKLIEKKFYTKKNLIKYKTKNKNKMCYALPYHKNNFQDEEKYIIKSVLILAIQSIHNIMMPRKNISWINTKNNIKQVQASLFDTPHNFFIVCQKVLDNIIGIIKIRELLIPFNYTSTNIEHLSSKILPIIILENLNAIHLITILRKKHVNIILVINKFGIIQGLITPLDILKKISKQFCDDNIYI